MIDFKAADFLANPYPALAELRVPSHPVWNEELGMFLAATHADANAVLRAKTLGRIFQPKQPESEWQEFNWLHADSILDSEPPKHTRLRSLVSKAFNRGKIESLRPLVERLANELADGCTEKLKNEGRFDIIADFAEPLPVKVIAAMLGFPVEDEHLLRPWSQSIVKMYEVSPSEQDRDAAKLAAHEFAEYVHGLMQQRKAQPADDLITDLVQVEEAGERLNAQELIATCVLLLNAGHEASVNGFGNGVVSALEREDQASLLREHPRELAETAVDEFLRFDAPLHLFERTATAETEIGGVVIAAGQKIAALLGSANRDAAVFDRADEMDLTRDPNPHIGFGAGIHFCIGAPLARMEMSVSLPVLFERFPKLRLESDPIRRPTFVLRGYERVYACE